MARSLLESIDRKDSRKRASAAVSYLSEREGRDWVDLNDAVLFVARYCGIDPAGKGRTALARECLFYLDGIGFSVPAGYVPPWERAFSPFSRLNLRARSNAIEEFYASHQWKRARYEVLVERGRRCECCGITAQGGGVMNVDHIEPLKRAWERRLDKTNLQVLCSNCNGGKGSKYTDDFRSSESL